jgi:NTE family protein
VDGAVANHTPIAAAIELGAAEIFVLPVGYPWLRQEPTNALGMALYALARFVEQKLDAEVAANGRRAAIHVLPTMDLPAASPADFRHTRELIARGHKWARRHLGPTPAIQPEKQSASRGLRLEPAPARAA